MAGPKISLNECYKILLISQNATIAEVKQAYRKRAFELHPDLNQKSDSASHDFQKLNEAYVIIIDHLDAQEKANKKAQSSSGSDTYSKSATKKQKSWSQKVWTDRQQSNEEKANREAERARRETERKERIERERQADERARARERAIREEAERERIREQMAKDYEKREQKRKEEEERRIRREFEQDEREKARLLKQMEDEAKRVEAKRHEAARRVDAQKRKAEARQNAAKTTSSVFENTHTYSSTGKPILDKNQYKNDVDKSAPYSDTFTYSQKNDTAPLEDEAFREQILQELLEDDYARKVYEDIYNELQAKKNKPKENKATKTSAKTINNEQKEEQKKPIQAEYIRPPKQNQKASVEQKAAKKKKLAPQNLTEKIASNISSGVTSWIKNQIDDELEIFLPAARLVAGARMRLQLRTGWIGEAHTVELTLPADFVPGKPFRLRGMGKKIGKWQGDLYLKLQAK